MELRRDQLSVGALIIFVLLPCICVLSRLYSVFEQPAGWVTTYAFIRGTTPSIIMLLVWNVILLYFRHLLADDGRIDTKSNSNSNNNDDTGIGVGVGAHLYNASGSVNQEEHVHVTPLNSVAADNNNKQGQVNGRASEHDQIDSDSDFSDFDFDSSEEFLGLGELEKDAAAMNDNGVRDIEWAIQLFSGIFLGVFLWDSMGLAVGVPMVAFPTVVTISLSLSSRCSLFVGADKTSEASKTTTGKEMNFYAHNDGDEDSLLNVEQTNKEKRTTQVKDSSSSSSSSSSQNGMFSKASLKVAAGP